jgi:hypothetical protein
MAHFYAHIDNHGRGKAPVTCAGDRTRGLTTHTAAWAGAVKVALTDHCGVDWAEISLVPWSADGPATEGKRILLYSGPVNGPIATSDLVARLTDAAKALA